MIQGPTTMSTHFPKPLPIRPSQHGATLLELLVGITIGLLTVAVAVGALVVSRGISGTVSEASQLQQQASYAFRVIGQQLRQAGSRQLDPLTTPDVHAKFYAPNDVPVEFSGIMPISGKDAPGTTEFALEVNYQNIKELTVLQPTDGEYQIRNCLQEKAEAASVPLPMVSNKFKRNTTDGTLVCAGTGAAQPIIQNVKDFTIQYLTQATDGTPSAAPTYQYVSATTAGSGWLKVYAVQVCLELEGTERIDTAGAKYIKCDGSEVDRGNKLRMVFRNTYHIRNHAWPTSS